MRTYLKSLAVLTISSTFLLPLVASAQNSTVDAAVKTSANIGTTGVSVTVTAKMQTAIGHADTEIARRVAALTDLNTRVQAMQRVTPTFKQTLTTNIQSEINDFTQLKAKVDADTDESTLKTDVQSITQSYRIYALILPQARIAAAADREVTIITMMNTLGSKLQTRIQAQEAGGNTVSASLAALTDMSSKLADANTQAQAAVSVSASLVPDDGDATKMSANTAALKTARADITAAQKDLIAARKDVTTITVGLKTSSSSTASSTQTTQ